MMPKIIAFASLFCISQIFFISFRFTHLITSVNEPINVLWKKNSRDLIHYFMKWSTKRELCPDQKDLNRSTFYNIRNRCFLRNTTKIRSQLEWPFHFFFKLKKSWKKNKYFKDFLTKTLFEFLDFFFFFWKMNHPNFQPSKVLLFS